MQAKIDSSKKAVSDTLQSVKKQVIKEAAEQLKNQLFNKKDTLGADTAQKTKPGDKLKESGKGLIEGLFKKKELKLQPTPAAAR